jgi:3-methylfumaryl-CoA hydratase
MAYNEWIGKTENRRDSMAPEQLQRFEATMNRDPSGISEGTELTPCAHWGYFTPVPTGSDLAENGTVRTGELMPPIDLPRRMWAGGIIRFKKPVKTGVPADRQTTITKIDEKEGRSGKLCFVTLRHQISAHGSIAIDEEQTLVYREESDKGAHPVRTDPLDIDPDWKRSAKPDAVQLFRFAAITFNSHRIHYDQDYTRETESYPNLLVPAPLLALLLVDAFKNRHDGRMISELNYKAKGPLYLGEEVTLFAKNTDNFEAELRACGPDGKIALSMQIKWIYSWS